nr:MAG TPA: hypothetical protein [Caudoviricetes sp.]
MCKSHSYKERYILSFFIKLSCGYLYFVCRKNTSRGMITNGFRT